jgi:signal transduction histidine kinase
MNPQLVTIPAEANAEPQNGGSIILRRPWLILARLAWILISLLAVGMLITSLVTNTIRWWNFTEAGCHDADYLPRLEECMANHRAYEQVFGTLKLAAIYHLVGASVEMLPWVLVGGLIFWRKSHEPFALFFSLGLVLNGVLIIDRVAASIISQYYSAYMPLWTVLGFFGVALLVLWYRFPDGRFVHRRMRWFAGIWIVLEFFSFSFSRSQLDYASWPTPFAQIIPITFVLSLVASVVFRYKRISDPLGRQQIRWVVVTGAIFGLLYTANFFILSWAYFHPGLPNVILNVTYRPLIYLSSAFFAVGIGISILRYRLWDIDIIINRTLVYGGLTVIVIGIYVLIVGALGTAIQGSGNLLISILATGLVAVLVQPLRDRLQRGVNRLMYGERDDPVTVLSHLGQRLEATIAPNALLPALVETITQTLKLPYAAITWGIEDHGEVAASYGQPADGLVRFPLSHQGEAIGQLVVASRAPGEALSPADHHLLKNIAHQAGMAVHAVSLTADLQGSRQRLVTAREEERRRLRRDLHDGLGPNLASQGLKLAAAKQLLEKDPASAAPLLDQVMAQNQSTVEEVRRLVYGLRPPALDELGLVAAIRDHVAGMDGKSTLQIEITEPVEGLPPLSAAVEVAAYRIVLEALTNVIRHAQAYHCAIRFSLSQNGSNTILQIEIQDDGIGLPPDLRAGVGLRSMRERAEELGGTCDIESVMGSGTRVCVRVPLIIV